MTTTPAFDALPLPVLDAIEDVTRAVANHGASVARTGSSRSWDALHDAQRVDRAQEALAAVLREFQTYVDPDAPAEPTPTRAKAVEDLTIADTLVSEHGDVVGVESVEVYPLGYGSIHGGTVLVHHAFGVMRKRLGTIVRVLDVTDGDTQHAADLAAWDASGSPLPFVDWLDAHA